MGISISTIVIIALISILISTIAYLLSKFLRKARYDEANNKAMLESYRNALEKQMYMLNEKMVLNEERWRDVNHLLLTKDDNSGSDLSALRKSVYYSDFLKANGIYQNDLIIDEKLIFILTPFNDKYSEDYFVIKDICIKSGFNAIRGDEHHFQSDIFPEMLKFIVQSRLVIANINGRNPNVLYELGIAQALDKTVLLLSREPENLPIDIKSKRFIIYKNYQDLQNILREELLNISVKR